MSKIRPFPKFLLLLLLLSVPRLGCCEDMIEDSDENDLTPIDDEIAWKYMMVWTHASLEAKRSSSREDFNPNIDIDTVNCTSNQQCEEALKDLDVALSYDSDLPSAPFCVFPGGGNSTNGTEIGHCTCGLGRCVSYSRQHSNSHKFYYCGPCGWVGSQCIEYTCTHHMAECKSGYCECTKDGDYYDMAYCYIPFYGQRMVLEMLVITAIIVICCAFFAYAYTRIGRNRADRRYLERWTRGSITEEAPTEDTPPQYDEVVEDKLPTYQDALEMSDSNIANKGNQNTDEVGINNQGFLPDHTLPPSYQESTINPTTSTTNPTPPVLEFYTGTSIASFPISTTGGLENGASTENGASAVNGVNTNNGVSTENGTVTENGAPTENGATANNRANVENEAPTENENGASGYPMKTTETLKKTSATDDFFDAPENVLKGPQYSKTLPDSQPIQQPLHAALCQHNQTAKAHVSEL